LLEAHALRVQESLLTGESEAVEKQTAALSELDMSLGDRRNLLFMGTLIATGRAEAVVIGTGMATELGRIATLLQQVGQEWTPLQKRLDRLGKVLAMVSIVVAALIFGVGLLRGEGLKEMLMMAVSVAVAAIPEGLPAVVTITLALGAQRMLKRHALASRCRDPGVGNVHLFRQDRDAHSEQDERGGGVREGAGADDGKGL